MEDIVWNTVYRCICLELALETQLTWTASILRPQANQQDEAGRPTYSNPTTVYTDLACFVQPADVSVEEYFGRKIMAGDFVVILGSTVTVLPHDSLTAYDPDNPTGTTQTFTILESRDPARIDEFQKLLVRVVQ